MREDLLLRNVGPEAAGVAVGYTVRADFADLFAVKEGRLGHHPDVEVAVGPDTLTYRCIVHGTTHSTTVTATREPVVSPGAVTYRAVVPACGEWSVCLSVRVVVGDRSTPLGPARVAVEVERDGSRIQGLAEGVAAVPPA